MTRHVTGFKSGRFGAVRKRAFCPPLPPTYALYKANYALFPGRADFCCNRLPDPVTDYIKRQRFKIGRRGNKSDRATVQDTG
jgi:hypothetical protein